MTRCLYCTTANNTVPRDIRKVFPLLKKLDSAKKRVIYYGLDLSRPSLESGISQILGKLEYVQCFGLWGTFDDARDWCQKILSPRWLLSLGSILGNDFLDPAILALSRWAVIMRPNDRMLLGMDGTMDKKKIWDSYHDQEGVFESFMRGGLEHSNRVFSEKWYHPEDWDVIGVWTETPLMHRFVFRARKDVTVRKINLFFPKDHEIDCYEAFKYGPNTMGLQFVRSGLQELAQWNAPGSSISESMVPPSTWYTPRQ